MYRKILSEFFLLSRGEQRSMIMVSLLLILSVGIRILVGLLPSPDPPGSGELTERAHLILAEFRRLDSLDALKDSIASSHKPYSRSWNSSRNDPLAILFPIELNSADSAALMPLPGIGPVFAARIIGYRELLGGYVSTEQLLEVYGMDSARYLPLVPLVSTDTTLVRRLDLNRASFRELLRHPYLEYEDVKSLVNYRDRVGQMLSVEELRINAILSDTVYLLARTYLDLSSPGRVKDY